MRGLVEGLRRYADGKAGGNRLTISCGDPDVRRRGRAARALQLVRVRMGGWSEYLSG